MVRRVTVVALGLAAVQVFALARMKTYQDPATGVAIAYPMNWRNNPKPNYIPAAILSNGGPTKALLRVGPAVAPNTNLTGVEFLYATAPAANEKACTAMAGSGGPGAWETIGGVRFWHVAGGDAAMMHQAVQNSYAAWRGGTCLLFEKGVYTTSPGVEPGLRVVSQARLDVVNKQLDGVMASVVIQKR